MLQRNATIWPASYTSANQSLNFPLRIAEHPFSFLFLLLPAPATPLAALKRKSRLQTNFDYSPWGSGKRVCVYSAKQRLQHSLSGWWKLKRRSQIEHLIWPSYWHFIFCEYAVKKKICFWSFSTSKRRHVIWFLFLFLSVLLIQDVSVLFGALPHLLFKCDIDIKRMSEVSLCAHIQTCPYIRVYISYVLRAYHFCRWTWCLPYKSCQVPVSIALKAKACFLFILARNCPFTFINQPKIEKSQVEQVLRFAH